MKEIRIQSFSELIAQLESLPNKLSLVFRGQSDSEWSLIPKAGRPDYAKSYSVRFPETDVFLSWKRYAVQFMAKEPSNEIDWYALAQHHGFATRLLDWTKNPLIATFFAVESNEEKDATVFTLNLKSRFLADQNIIHEMNPFKIDRDFVAFFPKGNSSRIVSQRGLFTISKNPEIPLEILEKDLIFKIKIDKKSKKDILNSLSFYGIDRLSIFQDLDSLSKHLNDYLLGLKKNPIQPDLNQI